MVVECMDDQNTQTCGDPEILPYGSGSRPEPNLNFTLWRIIKPIGSVRLIFKTKNRPNQTEPNAYFNLILYID